MDTDEIGTLMHVIEKAGANHPDLRHIHRHALHRLRKIDRELAEAPTDEPVPGLAPTPVVHAPVTQADPGRADTTGAVQAAEPNAAGTLAEQQAAAEAPAPAKQPQPMPSEQSNPPQSPTPPTERVSGDPTPAEPPAPGEPAMRRV